MKQVMKLLGILFILASISLIIKPEMIISWIEDNSETKSLYASAIAVRLILGAILIIAARKSRHPKTIKIIGYIFIIAAIIFVIIGSERFAAFVTTAIPTIKPYALGGGIFSLVFGGFIIYTFAEKDNS